MSGEGEPHGVALCLVTLVDIRPLQATDTEAACIELYPKANAWELTNLRAVKPLPVKGQLGLYDVELSANALKQTQTE